MTGRLRRNGGHNELAPQDAALLASYCPFAALLRGHSERSVTESKNPVALPKITVGYSTGSFDFAQDDTQGESLIPGYYATLAAMKLNEQFELAIVLTPGRLGGMGSDSPTSLPAETLAAVRAFLEAFEAVFETDWVYTKTMLGIRAETPEQAAAAQKLGLETIPIISGEGTFLAPGVEDETEDWGYRGMLLERYRRLKMLMDQHKAS